MKIPAYEKEVPGATDEQFTDEIVEAEARKILELQQAGVLRELYFSDKKDEVLVLECESVEEARRQLSEMPLVRAGLTEFEIKPLAAYPGFEGLFRRN